MKAIARMRIGNTIGSYVHSWVTEIFLASEDASLFISIIKDFGVPPDWALGMNIIRNCFKGKGDAMDRENYKGLKLLEHLVKIFWVGNWAHTSMQFGFMQAKGRMGPISILCQMQETKSCPNLGPYTLSALTCRKLLIISYGNFSVGLWTRLL